MVEIAKLPVEAGQLDPVSLPGTIMTSGNMDNDCGLSRTSRGATNCYPPPKRNQGRRASVLNAVGQGHKIFDSQGLRYKGST